MEREVNVISIQSPNRYTFWTVFIIITSDRLKLFAILMLKLIEFEK